MNQTLLTLENLYDFYNQRKRSAVFSSEKSGYNLTVQTHGLFEVKDDLSEGLLYGNIKAFHDLNNNNRSHIETNLLEEKMMSMKDRPIMADIIDTNEKDQNGNPIKDFSGHTMHYDEKLDKMIYKESPVGHCVNPESIHIEYDEENERNFVYSDVVLYEEYTDACAILRRRKTVDCSVELTIKQMHWDATAKVLYLDDFYVQGITLLGKNVQPGMKGSKLSLSDFSQSNNSTFSNFSESEYSKLIETLDNLNKTLSKLNTIEKETFEKGGINKENMTKFEELLSKYNKTVEDITFEYEDLSDEELESKFAEMFDDKDPEEIDDPETTEETPEDDSESSDPEDPENDDDSDDVDDEVKEVESAKDADVEEPTNPEKFNKTFTLSHEDLRASLYALLAPIEQTLNECYWIAATYDDHFVYESCCGNFYSQKFTTENDTISFVGERTEVFTEFVTADERAELENMRANYSSISEKLAKYEDAEAMADKMTVFTDEAYTNYLDTEEFKNLMLEDNVRKFSKEELVEKADATLGRLVKTSKTFAYEPRQEKKTTAPMFAFAKVEQNNSFLDNLLKKKI